MEHNILGIHHITAIASDPQRNIDFYTKVLGLRLVKLTVNFDDPTAYHLYYGDEYGHPGTLLTFFTWPGISGGRQGLGQAVSIAFSIPEESIAFWIERLTHFGISYEHSKDSLHKKFNDNAILFKDPDGILLELIADPKAHELTHWEGVIADDNGIRGIYGVTILEDSYEKTADLLNNVFHFKQITEENNIYRYSAQRRDIGQYIDVQVVPGFWQGISSVGTIHHVAWRVTTDEGQKEWHSILEEYGSNVTPIIDREYFHSIYFHEPGGVLFEIATDPPGMTVDEPLEKLGNSLKLPPWYENSRDEIQKALPPIVLPIYNKND